MAEEFEESEVVFQEINVKDGACDSFKMRKKLKTTATCDKISVPVSIPENVSWLRYVDPDLDGDDGELVPPHVLVGRRVAGKMMALSVCSGNGRTLKGRDLSQVRNSVLRLTGFLETYIMGFVQFLGFLQQLLVYFYYIITYVQDLKRPLRSYEQSATKTVPSLHNLVF